MKGDGEKRHQNESERACKHREHGQAPAADKKQRRGNEYDEKSRQFAGQFQECPLQAVQSERVVQEIIENRIDGAFGKADHCDTGNKQLNVFVDRRSAVNQFSYHAYRLNRWKSPK